MVLQRKSSVIVECKNGPVVISVVRGLLKIFFSHDLSAVSEFPSNDGLKQTQINMTDSFFLKSSCKIYIIAKKLSLAVFSSPQNTEESARENFNLVYRKDLQNLLLPKYSSTQSKEQQCDFMDHLRYSENLIRQTLMSYPNFKKKYVSAKRYIIIEVMKQCSNKYSS